MEAEAEAEEEAVVVLEDFTTNVVFFSAETAAEYALLHPSFIKLPLYRTYGEAAI